jgi:regulator of PEP synthase PpsR (kinase-PPPase family)
MSFQKKKRKVFFVSDRTGLTAESYGSSLLAQFPGFEFDSIKHAYVDSEEQALITAGVIDREAILSDDEPIVFSTLVEPDIQNIIENTNACVINLFGTFLGPLEECLGEQSAHTLGKSIDVFGRNGYAKRLDAIDYALAHDDGVRPDQYDDAEIILVGVSRSGKTPTCLLLAMNHSICACNYPLTEDELDKETLPDVLLKHKHKLIGLTISPGQLSNIREKRRPGSKYASLNYCKKEVKIAEQMFARANIPFFETTDTSIEELAGSVIKTLRTLTQQNNAN